MSTKNNYPLTNERHYMNSYFCIHVPHLLDFNTNDRVSFDIKYILYK